MTNLQYVFGRKKRFKKFKTCYIQIVGRFLENILKVQNIELFGGKIHCQSHNLKCILGHDIAPNLVLKLVNSTKVQHH
jgi:hypothetical protein